MGRKSVPFADESALLTMRLHDIEHVALSVLDDGPDDDENGEEAARTGAPWAPLAAAAASGAPAELSIADLYRLHRNRARLAGLLHAHRAYQGTAIVVLMQERDETLTGAAAAWIANPLDARRLVPARPPRAMH